LLYFFKDIALLYFYDGCILKTELKFKSLVKSVEIQNIMYKCFWVK